LATEAANATFIGQIAVALTAIAQAVIAEDQAYYTVIPVSGSGVGQHYARVKLANYVLSNPLGYAQQQFAYYTLADFTTTSSSTDNAILARVLAMWNDLATPYLT
jgi:hypothetical protein